MALPFRRAFPTVHHIFASYGLAEQVVFGGAGKLGFAPDAALALAMGVDLIGVAREAMLAIGCIQAQECHTGHCPTGVATQKKRLIRGLDPTDKAARLDGYVRSLRHELRTLAHAMGHAHPSEIRLDEITLADGAGGWISADEAVV